MNNLDDFTDHQFLLNEAYNVILTWMTEEGRQPRHINYLITNYASIVPGIVGNPSIRILLNLAALEAVALKCPTVLKGTWENIVVNAVVNSACLRGVGFPQSLIHSICY